MHSRNRYHLPLPKEKILSMKHDSPAHIVFKDEETNEIWDLSNSVDFLCKERTQILAAYDGTVIHTQTDIKKNYSGKEIPSPDVMTLSETDGNSIVLKHEHGEHTNYCHLHYGGIKVNVGEDVKAGDIIGESGHTGWSMKPHLHFEVFVLTGHKRSYKTLKIRWEKR